ncbi:MAG: MotA/TolQ/ExbB proton channel family protein [Longimicrobiales bacterium]|nr:MotA/TolQ/ExbB proton channel family protein [Longimicrobiales bacterium]
MDRALDKASVLGVLAGTLLVLGSIATGKGGIAGLIIFVNVQGLLIVIGGTFAALCIAFPGHELKLIFPVSSRVFRDPGVESDSIGEFLMESMATLKREGRVALERRAGEAPLDALSKGLMLIADGANASTIQEILATERKYVEEHHKVGQKMFTELGKYTPAFGMIGTLIGLVQMLADLNDPASLGPSMAVALLTTFYGAVLANLMFLPMVSKLDRRGKIEVAQIELAMIGLASMTKGDTVQIMQEKLEVFRERGVKPKGDQPGMPEAQAA